MYIDPTLVMILTLVTYFITFIAAMKVILLCLYRMCWLKHDISGTFSSKFLICPHVFQASFQFMRGNKIHQRVR